MNRNQLMIRKMLISLTNILVKVSEKLSFHAFLFLMKTFMLLLLCVTTLPCLLLELIVEGDDILEKYKTITANFHEQRATDY